MTAEIKTHDDLRFVEKETQQISFPFGDFKRCMALLNAEIYKHSILSTGSSHFKVSQFLSDRYTEEKFLIVKCITNGWFVK